MLGLIIPYWALYLTQRGFSVIEVGQLMGALALTKLFAPYLWGYLADSFGRRLELVRICLIAAVGSFMWVILEPGFWPMFFAIIGFSFFWNAVLPQMEAVTLDHLATQGHMYGRIRIWGSVSFIAMVFGGGWLFDHINLSDLPWVMILFLGCTWVALGILDDPFMLSKPAASKEQVWVKTKESHIGGFFFICFLMMLSHGPFYTFFSPYLASKGYPSASIGMFWALSVLLEVVLFWFAPRWIKRFDPKPLMLFCLVMAVLRWVLLALFSDEFWGLAVSQGLSAFTYGLFHLAVMQWIYVHFPAGSQGRGQALYCAAGFGAGGALGSLGAGYLWDHFGASTTFLVAAAVAAFAFIIAFFLLKPTNTSS